MSNRIPFLNQYINTSNNTNLNNTYTSGSGVGAKSISNRRALIRRSSLNAGNLTDPKKGKCSGFCTAWGLQPMPGFNFLPIPPLYKSIPQPYSFQMYYVVWMGTTSPSRTNNINDLLASSDPILLQLPIISDKEAVYFNQNEGVLEAEEATCPTGPDSKTNTDIITCLSKKFATLFPQGTEEYWEKVFNNLYQYALALEARGYLKWTLDFGIAPVSQKITPGLYGDQEAIISRGSPLFNLMVAPGRQNFAETIVQYGGQKILLNIFNPNQKNIISSTFNLP